MALSPNEVLPKILRDLADAIERRNAAWELHEMDVPTQIGLYDHRNVISGPLSIAIQQEIRLSWFELRDRALSRLNESVQQLAYQVQSLTSGEI